jgi:Holliday junction resolvase RusA-like endonuclease
MVDIYKFTINSKLPSLNDYIDACRRNKYKAAAFKKNTEDLIGYEIRNQLNGLKIKQPVIVGLHFIEENKRRDVDNVYSAAKYVLDALVKAKVLLNDSPKYVEDVKPTIEYGKTSKVIVTLLVTK